MGWLRLATRWLAAALPLATGCSAGVLDSTGGGAFGTTSATTTMTSTATDPGGSSSGMATASESNEGEASMGETAMSVDESSAEAPVETSGDPSTSEGTARCGDGTAQAGEDCDGMDLADATCVDFGFEDGVLACDPACSLITEACFTCGDGEIALSEVCDGDDFDGATCQSLGFGGGALACIADCSEIDDSGCTPLPSCGDGILNGGEQCDGIQLGAANCVTQGFDLGTLSCNGNCTFNTANCMDDLTNCGMMGDFCIFDENDLQSTCCPAGVGGNKIGICNVFICV